MITREKNIKKQEENLAKEIISYNEDIKKLQVAQNKFYDEVSLVRKENDNHQKLIRSWEEAAFIIDNGIENKSTDEWIDSEATKLKQGKQSFQNFINKMKTGVKGNMQERLIGLMKLTGNKNEYSRLGKYLNKA